MQQLIDQHKRQIKKLRVSVIDACNFRCLYCMPLMPKFLPHSNLLTAEEIVDICAHLQNFGIEEFRVTGGEPLVRGDIRQIVTSLSSLRPKKLGLTTNGYFLAEHLDFFKHETSCHHINISIDSLKEERFNAITRRRAFDRVMEAIIYARELSLPIKLNVIAMRGQNDDEFNDFVAFSEQTGIPVRFLELMRIGKARDLANGQFISAQEIIAAIKSKFSLQPIESAPDSTSFNFQTKGGAQVGFIASESMPFCGNCSRWRLSASGHLRACLMSQDGISLKGVKRNKYPEVFQQLLPMKPTGRIREIEQNMNQIGG